MYFCFVLFHSIPFSSSFSVRVVGMLPLLSPFFKGSWPLLGPNQVNTMGVGQGTPWMSRQLIAGPLLMAEAATQGANCTSEQFWSSVSCSRILRHVFCFVNQLFIGSIKDQNTGKFPVQFYHLILFFPNS